MKYVILLSILISSLSCNPKLNIYEKYPADISEKVYTINEVDIKPIVLDKANSFYTKEAVDAGIEGTVIVIITIAVNGEIEDVSVSKGLNQQLDYEAIAAANSSTFSPAIKNGKRVKCKMNVPFEFSLK